MNGLVVTPVAYVVASPPMVTEISGLLVPLPMLWAPEPAVAVTLVTPLVMVILPQVP